MSSIYKRIILSYAVLVYQFDWQGLVFEKSFEVWKYASFLCPQHLSFSNNFWVLCTFLLQVLFEQDLCTLKTLNTALAFYLIRTFRDHVYY